MDTELQSYSCGCCLLVEEATTVEMARDEIPIRFIISSFPLVPVASSFSAVLPKVRVVTEESSHGHHLTLSSSFT